MASVTDRAPVAVVVPVADRRARTMSLAVLLSVGAMALVPGMLSGEAGWLVLAAGLFLGLPHGAVDHLVPGWALGRPLPARTFVAVLLAYVALAGLAFGLLQAVPVVAAAAFLAVSVGHFGAGDVEFLGAGPLFGRVGRLVAVLAFGLPPIALPIAVHAEQAEGVLVGLDPSLIWLTSDPVRAVSIVVTALAVIITAGAALRKGRGQIAIDLVVLAVTFVVAPPLIAFAAYFGCWHAARHIARLLALDPANDADLRAGRIGRPLVRFAVGAIGPTVVALVVLLGLWWGAGGAEGLVAAHLGLLVALTMPHYAMVSWWDRSRRSADGVTVPDGGRDRAASLGSVRP